MAIEQRLLGLAVRLDKSKATREEVAARMREIIDEEVKSDRDQILWRARCDLEEKHAVALAVETAKLEEEKRRIIAEDPKCAAALRAVDQATEAALLPGEHEPYLCQDCRRGQGITKRLDSDTRVQLVRTIGLIWAAALGMRQMGNSPAQAVPQGSVTPPALAESAEAARDAAEMQQGQQE